MFRVCGVVVVVVGLAACGGGGSGSGSEDSTVGVAERGGTTTPAPSVASTAPLLDQLEAQGSLRFSGPVRLLGQFDVGEKSTTIDRNFNVTVETVSRGTIQFPAPDEPPSLGVDVRTTDDRMATLYVQRPVPEGELGFSYTSFGDWAIAMLPGSLDSSMQFANEIGTFFIGAKTPANNMPVAGTTRYNGVATAAQLTGTRYRSYTGSVTLDADFKTGRMAGSVDLDRFPQIRLEDIRIDGSDFSGTASSAANFRGRVNGGFTGPRAQELGGRFDINSSGDFMMGAFAARR